MGRIEQLDRAILSAFEQMTFLEVQQAPDEASDCECIQATIQLLSPFRTELSLCVPTTFVRELVDSAGGGMLDADDLASQYDVVGEIANVIAGLYAGSADGSVRLGLPTMSSGGDRNALQYAYRSDDHVFFAGVSDDDTPALSTMRPPSAH